MSRISRTEMYFDIAKIAAKRSTCNRLQVGAVAVKDKRIIAISYNGALPGRPHCDDFNCNDTTPCTNTVHAEANLIAYCAKHGLPLDGTILYLTHSPCMKCSELIVQSGIKQVYFLEQYRDSEPLKVLKDMDVSVASIKLK